MYYTTTQQFTYYKNFAIGVFDYLSNKIVRFIKPILIVDFADYMEYTFANSRKPDKIFLHIDNVVSACGNALNKNRVCSMIFMVLTHELFHLEQNMSQEMYRTDKEYRDNIEYSVNVMSLNLLRELTPDINRRFNMVLDLSYLLEVVGSNMTANANYIQCKSVESIYKATIANVIFRHDRSFEKFNHEVLSNYDNITVRFNDSPNFIIKSNGDFCGQNLNDFIQATNAAVGLYDRYTVNVNVQTSYRGTCEVAEVTFNVSKRSICPMIFG